MEIEITPELLRCFQDAYEKDPVARAARNTLSKASMADVCFEGRAQRNMTHHFSLEIPTMEACNQESSGRCWLFAALNLLRETAGKKLDLENFELSPSYLFFYDQLEKSNSFLEHILETAGEPLDSRYVSMLLRSPVGDGGWWEYFQGLCLKYGICPREAMEETYQSTHTESLGLLLCRRLRQDALQLRQQAASGIPIAQLREEKQTMLERVYTLLCACLGQPPRQFDFEYCDRQGTYHRDPGLTPLSFYEKYLGEDLSSMVSILNAPLPDVPFHTTCYTRGEESIRSRFPAKRLNLPLEEFKAAVLRQLEAGEPVWFVCDSDCWEGRTEGIWDPELYDCSHLLGDDASLSKGELLQLRQCSLNHAMVFTGVDLLDGKPRKWKIQNSWGREPGDKGYYVCSDRWFDRYVFTATIRLSHLTDQQRQDFQKEPQILPPWHVLG